jgi:hypothetical protein
VSTPDELGDPVDDRPREAVRWWAVVCAQEACIAACERRGNKISGDVRERMRYVEEVLCHGNGAGRSNPTIILPSPYTLADVEAVIGRPDDVEPGSDAAWRAVRRHYDASHGDRAAGRARS